MCFRVYANNIISAAIIKSKLFISLNIKVSHIKPKFITKDTLKILACLTI